MVDERAVRNWVEGYIEAWESNDPEQIGNLFSDQALYYTGPFDEPWRGRDGIVSGWLKRKDEPGTYSFRYEVLSAVNDVGIVRGWTVYFEPKREYSNIWLVRFDDQNRSKEFIEWWVQRK